MLRKNQNYIFKLALKFVSKVTVVHSQVISYKQEKVWNWCEYVVRYAVFRKLWIISWTMSSIAKRLFNALNTFKYIFLIKKYMKMFQHIPLVHWNHSNRTTIHFNVLLIIFCSIFVNYSYYLLHNSHCSTRACHTMAIVNNWYEKFFHVHWIASLSFHDSLRNGWWTKHRQWLFRFHLFQF